MAWNSTIITHLFLVLVLVRFPCSTTSQTWIKAGYWFSGSNFPISDINSPLFTHLLCAFAALNSTTYQLSLISSSSSSSSDNIYQRFSTFTSVVQRKNPSITTLLSIGGHQANPTTYSSMVSQSLYRKSFIESSIETARLYGFHGLDFSWVSAQSESDMSHMATLFEEWRAAIESEAANSGKSKLILTMTVPYIPIFLYPIESMRKNLDWVHVVAFEYHTPNKTILENFTAAHAALYDPGSEKNTNYGINSWINSGLSANKLVLGLPFYGYAWKLVNPKDGEIGAPANGPAITNDGALSYKYIKSYISTYGGVPMYNETYVVNYYSTKDSIWIGFDDVEVVKIKVAYAKSKKLLGYYVWEVSHDNNWVLSQAAQGVEENHQSKLRLLLIILPTMAIFLLLAGSIIWYLQKRVLKSKGTTNIDRGSESKLGTNMAALGSTSTPNMLVFSFAEIKVATNNFSSQNKLGQGGYGPVYKGILSNGQEMAVKRLSKTSSQGDEEFRNEVFLTAKLQHVNLVRVLGFCTQREEKLVIYEYMPNKSLDYYIYDPIRRFLLDWERRVQIIEGVIQGMLYLQEYSRLTIIHRDLKASNILLDHEMKPKISDFGLAKIFQKDEFEANTDRIVGTYGCVPPEYINQGIYSTKSDVYSFGVLLLQIISGKPNRCVHGLNENLNLLEHAYDLWKNGKGMEFMDSPLEDSSSSCKLIRCLQIALLCVQENPVDRPSILEVYSKLKHEILDIKSPKKPAFSTKTEEAERIESSSRKEIWSVNDTTITQMLAR